MLRTRKAKKGLSGAVVTLILVIVAVLLALAVAAYVFNLFGSFGGTPQVQIIGTATLQYTNNGFVLTVTLTSSGPVQIVSATLLNPPGLTAQGLPIALKPGTNTITITFTNSPPVSLLPGATYTISPRLSAGENVQVPALYQAPT